MQLLFPVLQLFRTTSQPFSGLFLRLLRYYSNGQENTALNHVPAPPLSCTIQLLFHRFYLHPLHNNNNHPVDTVPLHLPVLPLSDTTLSFLSRQSLHLHWYNSSWQVRTAPSHTPALPPCGTVLRPLPRPGRHHRRPHSTHPAHTVLPGIPVLPLWCTTLQPPHCTRVPHTAARSYTALLHFPELPPLRTICGPLCRPFQRPEPDNSTRPVRTVPRHRTALRPFCTTRPHFLRFFPHQCRSDSTGPLPTVPQGVRNLWPRPCTAGTPFPHCLPADNFGHYAGSPARFPPAFPAALPRPDKSVPHKP